MKLLRVTKIGRDAHPSIRRLDASGWQDVEAVVRAMKLEFATA